MKQSYFSGYLAILLAILSVTHGQDLKVTISTDLAQVGEDITLQCRVPNLGGLENVFWNKQQVTTDGEPDRVALKNVIVSKYENLGRMQVSHGEEGDDYVLTLTISGVQLEDSGHYTCSREREDHDTVIKGVDLTVGGPIGELHMYGLQEGQTEAQELMDGQGVELVKLDSYRFKLTCSALGSNPAPTFKITFGDDDITNQFSSSTEEKLAPLYPDGDVTEETNHNLNLIQYDTTVINTDFLTVDQQRKNEKLMCTASVPGQEDQTIHVRPVVKIAPTVNCLDLMTIRNQMNVTLVCDVTAYPAFHNATWSWHSMGSIVTLGNGEREGKFRAYSTKGEDPDTFQLALNMERAMATTFNLYTLTVYNDVGKAEDQAELLKDPIGESKFDTGCPQSTVSIVMLTLLGLLAICKNL